MKSGFKYNGCYRIQVNVIWYWSSTLLACDHNFFGGSRKAFKRYCNSLLNCFDNKVGSCWYFILKRYISLAVNCSTCHRNFPKITRQSIIQVGFSLNHCVKSPYILRTTNHAKLNWWDHLGSGFQKRVLLWGSTCTRLQVCQLFQPSAYLKHLKQHSLKKQILYTNVNISLKCQIPENFGASFSQKGKCSCQNVPSALMPAESNTNNQ